MKYPAPISSLMAITCVLCLISSTMAKEFDKKLQGKTVAVATFPANKEAERFQRTAQTRLETILADNGITALDREKAKELKDIWKRLEDPGYFVTAEDFVDNADKYNIQGIARVYLSVEPAPGLAGTFSAVAQADIRIVKSDAKVTSDISPPMGAPGSPPSAGLTQASASLNAVQRAIDQACLRMGLDIIDPASPRAIRLKLEGPLTLPKAPAERPVPPVNEKLASMVLLEQKRWKKEKVSATAYAPGKSVAAVAGYIIDTDIRRRPQRMYGSRVHLLDVTANKKVNTLECFPVSKKARAEKGSREIVDCMFVKSWRYLACLTGSSLFFWDTERGRLLSELSFNKSMDKAQLNLLEHQQNTYLVVRSGDGQSQAYLITVDR